MYRNANVRMGVKFASWCLLQVHFSLSMKWATVTLNLYRLPNLYRARHPYVIHSKPAWQQTIASNDVKGSRTFANLLSSDPLSVLCYFILDLL